MSIRSEARSYRGELAYPLQDLLRRNGMRAEISVRNDRYYLLVQGHDSPLLEYPINEKQLKSLTDGGSSYANKNAYKTFNNIVSKDFDMPSSYVSASHVNGRVAMGLHGYRERSYIGHSPHAFGSSFLGWTPRNQDGYHLRRIGGAVVMEHSDGRLRPGELRSGSYGYYYKGDRNADNVSKDPLSELEKYFPKDEQPRKDTPVIPYKQHISSDVYFSQEKWHDVLSSHGIIIDEQSKTLTIQSSGAKADMKYDLTDEELKKLTSNSLKDVSVAERLSIMNNVIKEDFADKITIEMLNSGERISIALHPNVAAALQERELSMLRESPNDFIGRNPVMDERPHLSPTLDPEQGYVDGSRLDQYNPAKGWYRDGSHGREVEVGDIWVDKELKSGNQKEGKEKYTYRMSAVINGEVISHEISKRDYNKFMAVDDYQRQRMLGKIFKEVDMKTRPEMRQPLTFGEALGVGLSMIRDATYLGADIAHNIDRINHPRHSPELHEERHRGSSFIYTRPGVDNVQEIAERAFDAGVSKGMRMDENMGRGR